MSSFLADSTKDSPFTNTLGMKFVPVLIVGRLPSAARGTTAARERLLFFVWETRVRDFEAFVKESRHKWSKPDVDQGPTHAVAGVNWEDAQAFCQ